MRETPVVRGPALPAWAALMLALAASGCGVNLKLPGQGGPKTAKAEKGTLEVVLTEVGTIEPESKVEVKSLLGGKVKHVRVQPGDAVRRGAVLALIEPDVDQIRNLSTIRTSLAKARVEARNTRLDFENTKQLAGKDLVSAQELREMERRYEGARVDFETLTAQVRLLEEGGITLPRDGASARLEAFRIIAPSEGIILESRVQAGEVVTSGTFAFGGGGTPLFILADLSKMVLKASVNEVDIGKLQVGQAVTVSVDAFRGEKFEGRVTRVAPGARLSERVRVFDLEVKAGDPKRLMKPGMTANLDIHGEKKEGVLKVPIEGVFRKKGRDIVFRVKRLEGAALKKRIQEAQAAGTPVATLANGMDFEEREVKTGLASVEQIEITDGLKEGEEIFLEDPTLPKKEPSF